MRRTSSRISVDLSQDPRGRGGRVGSGVAGGARRGQSPPQERRTARRGTTTSVPMRPSTSLARRRRRSRPPARRRRREAERGAALISGLGHHAPSCVSLAPPAGGPPRATVRWAREARRSRPGPGRRSFGSRTPASSPEARAGRHQARGVLSGARAMDPLVEALELPNHQRRRHPPISSRERARL